MSSRKKQYTPEEKKAKLLEFFHKTADVYPGKEVESEGSKYTGFTMIVVKETLATLVEEGLVQTDKIGSSNYFWSFASFDLEQKKQQIADLVESIETIRDKITQQQEKNDAYQKERQESDERTKNIDKLEQLRQTSTTLKQELAKYGDYELIESVKEDIKIAISAINRYTDNISSLRNFCDRKYSIQSSDFNRSFEIDPNMDYYDEYKF
ncbi:hypothetical protein CYY_006457 [Polysphondylium violaceum]|uniref:Meiotic nuclear division protein 1 n=1 Tax=Polysphondylium violaceum TaxID=133409 RepID=A0A8J4PS37_9MYCE|nr:hypothetical protein CYY_006457 [Polysphondylium violaceum]